jgi:hypothetical protein
MPIGPTLEAIVIGEGYEVDLVWGERFAWYKNLLKIEDIS